MPFDGNGNYSLPSPAYPAIPGATITASNRNTVDEDIANAFGNVLCRDGQASATGNLPMGNNKLTGLAAGASAGDSLRFEQLFGASGPATAAGARANLEVVGYSSVRGLMGNVNAATPLTSFDLSAEAVVLRNATGGVVLRTSTGTLSCSISTAGPVAGGRDQAAAFAGNSWVHLYFIWNGTTLSLVASNSASAPTLPAGYTHWAYATALRWNASSNIIPGFVRGRRFIYDAGTAARIINGGAATSFTALNCSAYVPPNAPMAVMNFYMSAAYSSAGTINVTVRPTGSTQNGRTICSAWIGSAGHTGEDVNQMEICMNTSQQLDYKFNVALSSGGLYLDCAGFINPNGDS
jgi:hypothetical protein